MLLSERFCVGTRVRYVGYDMPEIRGCFGTVTNAPRLYRPKPHERERWLGLRILFDGDGEPVPAWPDQLEIVSVIDALADLASSGPGVPCVYHPEAKDMLRAVWLDKRVKSISANGVKPGHLGTVEEVGQGSALGFVWVRWDGSPARFRGKAVRVSVGALDLVA